LKQKAKENNYFRENLSQKGPLQNRSATKWERQKGPQQNGPRKSGRAKNTCFLSYLLQKITP